MIEVLKAKAAWSAVSVRKAGDGDVADLAGAGDRLGGGPVYRFHLYRPGEELRDPDDLKRVLLTIEEEAIVYAANGRAWIRRGDADWRFDDSLPTG